jgi:hypothetical protein
MLVVNNAALELMLEEAVPWMEGLMLLEVSPFLPYFVVPASPVMSYVNQTITLLASRIAQRIVNTNIQVDRMATELQYRGRFVSM